MTYKEMSLGELLNALSETMVYDVFEALTNEQREEHINNLIFNTNLKLPKSPFASITAEYIRDVIVLAQFNVHKYMDKFDAASIQNIIDTAQKRVDHVIGSPLSFKATEAKENMKPVSY